MFWFWIIYMPVSYVLVILWLTHNYHDMSARAKQDSPRGGNRAAADKAMYVAFIMLMLSPVTVIAIGLRYLFKAIS